MQGTTHLAVCHSDLAEEDEKEEEEEEEEQEEEEGEERRKRGRERKRRWRENSTWRNGTQTNKKVKIIYLNYICTCIYKTDAGNQLSGVISEKEEISFGCLVRKRFRMVGENGLK